MRLVHYDEPLTAFAPQLYQGRLLLSIFRQADGVFRPDVDAIDVHMAIAALGMFNVTNQYTFGAIFQRAMGAKGDMSRRRRMVVDIVLSWLSPS